MGFSAKLDSGKVRVWGRYEGLYLTKWTILVGPIIGFQYDGVPDVNFLTTSFDARNLSIIVGDSCRPKYFGAQNLYVRLGEQRVVQFYWQESFEKYLSACLSKGFSYI